MESSAPLAVESSSVASSEVDSSGNVDSEIYPQNSDTAESNSEEQTERNQNVTTPGMKLAE